MTKCADGGGGDSGKNNSNGGGSGKNSMIIGGNVSNVIGGFSNIMDNYQYSLSNSSMPPIASVGNNSSNNNITQNIHFTKH